MGRAPPAACSDSARDARDRRERGSSPLPPEAGIIGAGAVPDGGRPPARELPLLALSNIITIIEPASDSSSSSTAPRRTGVLRIVVLADGVPGGDRMATTTPASPWPRSASPGARRDHPGRPVPAAELALGADLPRTDRLLRLRERAALANPGRWRTRLRRDGAFATAAPPAFRPRRDVAGASYVSPVRDQSRLRLLRRLRHHRHLDHGGSRRRTPGCRSTCPRRTCSSSSTAPRNRLRRPDGVGGIDQP